MDDRYALRTFCHIDRMQPQFAAFLGTIAEGSPPVEGMAGLYVEMSPGNEITWILDKVLKATDVRPSASIVERQYGMFSVHSESQADVLRAGDVVLEVLGVPLESRVKPHVESVQVITNITPFQAQLMNRKNRGSMIVGGESMLTLEVEPAAYIALAANEAEKAASVRLNHFTSVGVFGRLWMSGTEAEIMTAKDAAIRAIEEVTGT
jgi:ethanolamine utilization microcompartment shell protein EutL